MKFAQVKDLGDGDNCGHFGGYSSFEFCEVKKRGYGKTVFVEFKDRENYQVYTSELQFIQEIEL